MRFRIVLMSGMAIALTSHAYTLTETQKDQYIRWHYGQKLNLAGNPQNQSGLTDQTIWDAVINGLQQWKRATQGVFDFDYWQGHQQNHFPTVVQSNGTNSLFFASQSKAATDPNVIGYTQVWFNSENGSIYETDIVFNDRDFLLTDNPNDTSSKASQGKRRVYFNNVVTHELGHAIGLSHSNSINSSMLYVEFSEQFKLGCDDWSAAKHLYPIAGNGMGSLTGTIRSANRLPVSGAVVTAISIKKGLPVASVHTDNQGRFNFGALESDEFSIMIDPYQGAPASVPKNVRVKRTHSVCNQNEFPKNFINTEDGFSLETFKVNPGLVTDAGSVELSCNEVARAAPRLVQNFPRIFADQDVPGSIKEYRFTANGRFKVTALGYLILSPIKVTLSAFDQFGSPISTTATGSLYRSGISDFRIEDSGVEGVAYGPITIRAEIESVNPSRFPTPAVWPGKTPAFVIVFNDDFSTNHQSTIPSNGRCESLEPFLPYSSPNGNPPRYSSIREARDNIGFCGNAVASEFGLPNAPKKHSSRFSEIVAWFLPFWVAIVCQLSLRFRRSKIRE